MALRDKVLIIGNGFDLYHELPTKYSQFIKVLMNIEALNIDNQEITFDDLFKNIERNHEMKSRFDTEKMIFDANKITEIKNKLQNNSWYNLFKTKLNYENWIDIENEIKYSLKIIDKIILTINRITENDRNMSFVDLGWLRSQLINAEENNYILKFPFLENDDNRFKNELFKKENNVLIAFKKEQFYENLFTELQTFINIFNNYLEAIVGSFYDKMDSKYASSLEDIKQNIKSFYTFNYTPTLEKLYGVKKVNYLHGKHSLENHNIVLGIEEDDAEFQKDKVFMFTKYYQKLFNDTDYEFLPETKPNTPIYEDNKDFILFGHSLAENDQNYIKELFFIGKQRENTISVLFYNLNDKAQKLKNLLKIIGREDIEHLMKKKKLKFIKIEDKPFEEVFKSLPESFEYPTPRVSII